MDFGIGIFRIEIDFDSWFWYPYILQGKYVVCYHLFVDIGNYYIETMERGEMC